MSTGLPSLCSITFTLGKHTHNMPLLELKNVPFSGFIEDYSCPFFKTKICTEHIFWLLQSEDWISGTEPEGLWFVLGEPVPGTCGVGSVGPVALPHNP